MDVSTKAQDNSAAAVPQEALRSIEHARELHRRAVDWCCGIEVELYLRTSSALRVGFNEASSRPEMRTGEEQGLALRARAGDAVGFAATSGASEAALRWVVAACRKVRGGGPWGEPEGEPVAIDTDAPLEVPQTDALESWLAAARESALESRAGSKGLRAGWIEVAATVETLVTPGGRVRCRTRSRAWSSVTPRFDVSASPSLRAAARRFADLSPLAWRQGLEDRATGGANGSETIPKGPRAVLLTPECSARLALAMVRELHEAEIRDLPLGPGWRLADEPGATAALFGGDFDDLGHSTERTELADGRRWLAALEGPGHYRRASFRDRPLARPFHLRLDPPPGEPVADGLLIDRLEVHPTGSAWVLLAGGRWMRAGHAWPRFVDVRIRTSPQELVLQCMAGVGPPRESHLGIVTPALLFDGLPVS